MQVSFVNIKTYILSIVENLWSETSTEGIFASEDVHFSAGSVLCVKCRKNGDRRLISRDIPKANERQLPSKKSSKNISNVESIIVGNFSVIYHGLLSRIFSIMNVSGELNANACHLGSYLPFFVSTSQKRR